jgi:hypothetical protein
MAELSEAFECFNTENKNFQNIDYFFTQRNLKESHEYLDKNMNRKNKHVNIIYNFLAISVPTYNLIDKNDFFFDVEIFGDSGYHYKGALHSFRGVIPNLMIPLKGDKKIFVHVNYKNEENSIKDYVCFIEVPKRYQTINNINNADIEVDL